MGTALRTTLEGDENYVKLDEKTQNFLNCKISR